MNRYKKTLIDNYGDNVINHGCAICRKYPTKIYRLDYDLGWKKRYICSTCMPMFKRFLILCESYNFNSSDINWLIRHSMFHANKNTPSRIRNNNISHQNCNVCNKEISNGILYGHEKTSSYERDSIIYCRKCFGWMREFLEYTLHDVKKISNMLDLRQDICSYNYLIEKLSKNR